MNQSDWAHIDKMVNAITVGLSKYAPPVASKAWVLALYIKRADCIGQIAVGLIWLLLSVAALVFAALALRRGFGLIRARDDAKAAYDAARGNDHAERAAYYAADQRVDRESPPWFVAGAITLGVSGAVTIVQLMTLSNYWTWVGAYAPEIALGHDVLVKVLGN